MLKVDLWKSSSDNIHITFEDRLHGNDVDIKITPKGKIYTEGLVPAEGTTTVYDILDELLTREKSRIDAPSWITRGVA
jgi:hypothetical protein